jgi:asparagine synthase (glutamine-hydrolysing)
MCGIAGVLDFGNGASRERLRSAVRPMIDAIPHRGPDGDGIWASDAGAALGHRRLSILDLSASGAQPMTSAEGRYVIVFNGEMYNHHALRKEIEKDRSGPAWRGHSDTEVMLAAFERWGVEGALTRFNGMFAFALWDVEERTLHLARDRFGEKPLYYGMMGDVLLFGSELKALKAHPAWRGEIDRGALSLYVRHNYVPAPYCIYRGIRKLLPGHFLSVAVGHGTDLRESRPYWSARQVVESAVADPFLGSEKDAIDALDILLRDAVALRMEADVPLGALLSGGYDSSAVVALMQAQSPRPVKTFTIGFHEAGYNEADHAKAVARHLGTDHTELYVTSGQAMDVIPLLPAIYDEPFADSSQIPTFLVAQMTRRDVTVALSGDGGDELFGGYHRYFWGENIWRQIGWLPQSARRSVARGVMALSPQQWDQFFERLNPILPRTFKTSLPGNRMHKLAGILGSASSEAMYHGLVSQWNPDSLVLGGTEPLTALTDRSQLADLRSFTQRMMFLDLLTYLPDDILAKVDRASMAVSLETRVPFLDHRVAEFAWRLPQDFKTRSGQGKRILRALLHRYVPQEIMERPKMGFGVPIDHWLRGPLREWAESLLDESRMRQQGYLDPKPVHQKWREHLLGTRNWAYQLWVVLMFQAWIEASSESLEMCSSEFNAA